MASGAIQKLSDREGVDYIAWLNQISVDERKRISAIFRDYSVKDYKDIVSFTQIIMAEVIEGNLTPVVSRELRYWTEIMFTAIATENSAAGTPENAMIDITAALISVSKRMKTPVLDLPGLKEPMYIEAEQE